MNNTERKNLLINKKWLVVLAYIFIFSGIEYCHAEDWLTYNHDYHRSGYTTEQLQVPLVEGWTYSTSRGPRPAWDETPALQDFWQNLHGNKSRMPIENAFRVVVSGDRLYFGSSNTGKVTCIDTANGAEVWKYFAGGPVRFTPTLYQGRIYFGSDDGFVYCLNADDGSFVWKYNASGSSELMFINGRMISSCPVRTSVLVDDGVAYWAVGLFSGAQTGLSRYLCACNADTGAQIWRVTPNKPCQGYLLASTDNLYVPAGKSTPTFYRRSNGAYLGSFGSSRQGGAYALLSNDNKFYFGPHYSTSGSYIGKYNATTTTAESIAWGPGNYLVVTDEFSYYSTDTALYKIDRANQQVEWSVASSHPYELILAGDILFAGGNDEVAAISPEDGSVIWTAPVEGRVRGLAAANEKLYVSTDTGNIHAFGMFSSADLDRNGSVGLEDLVILSSEWLECTNPNDVTCHDASQN